MLRESTLFQNERLAYQKFVDYQGIYPLGSFVPENPHKINNSFVQMIPTKNSELMFNTLRNNFGFEEFDNSFEEDPTVYMVSGISSILIANQIYNVDTHITNISAEFLDNAGINMGTDTIRLVELTDAEDIFYYVFVGGKGAIEAKADEMFNAENSSYDGLPFQVVDGNIALDGISIVELAIAMANDLFDRNWIKEDSIQTQQVFGVNTPHFIDMSEIEKWIPADKFENWTDPARLGVVFAIKG